MPRLSLTSEQFRSEPTGRLYSVVDLSQSGMGLRLMDPSDQADFSIGAQLSGTLNLHRTKYLVRVVVRYVRADRVGCQWVTLPDPIQQVIAQFLEPRALGMDLKPIPSPLPSPLLSTDEHVFCFQGPMETTFVAKRQLDGQCSSLLLSVLKQFVQWEKETGLITGHTELADSADSVKWMKSSQSSELPRLANHPESSLLNPLSTLAPRKREWEGILCHETMLFHRDLNPDQKKLSVAKKLILSSNLSTELKTWCGRYFRFDCVG